LLRQVVDSSSLRSIGYDGPTQTLEIQFDGSVYRYLGVPSEVWLGLKQAKSKGKFFQTHVRDRYRTSRIS
jgi:KTSC domain-containing protein